MDNSTTGLWQPSWRESATAGHNFGRGPSNDYFIKAWFQLIKSWKCETYLKWEAWVAQWVRLLDLTTHASLSPIRRGQTRRFLCEFPIGSYVKLSSAVGAILVEGPNCLTYFWKRTIQWLFHNKIFSTETTEPISTKLCWNDPSVVPFQIYVWHFRPIC
jgi:hypothetical protein